MRERVNKGFAWGALLAGVAVVFGALIWGTFGRDHTHTVTVVKTKTQTVTRTVKVNGHYSGVQSLIEFMQPQQAAQAACPKGVPAGTKCFNISSRNFYVFLAAPS